MSRAFSLYLDAIRFLAALLVLLYHANWIYRSGLLFTTFGHEAVVVFFVLSGFVIAYVTDTREQDFREFMVARGARIFSVAIPAILLTMAVDAIGFHIDGSVYPQEYRAWDLPVVRMVTSALFLNEIWTLGIQLFTNTPYWSLNYEVWYYVVFGIVFFFKGKRRWLAFVLLSLLLGPKIVLLMPIWWLGVWVYRARSLSHISTPLAWLCLLLSLIGGYCYVHFALGDLGPEYLRNLLGVHLHKQLSFSGQFITDYYLGAVLALHFVGVRVLLAPIRRVPEQLQTTIRYLAGATFSIYLFHQPILWFYSAIFSSVQEGLARYLVVVPLTIVSVFVLSRYTEQKKDLWKGWIEQLLGVMEQFYSKFRALLSA